MIKVRKSQDENKTTMNRPATHPHHSHIETRQMPNHILLEEVRRQLRAGHTVTLRVKGNSMRPFLESGRDKVLLAPPQAVKIGDVALILADDGRYILHRIVALDRDGGCTLWGDGNVRGREHASAENIIGIASGFYRYKSEHYYSCDSLRWQCYSAIWMHTTPFMRRCLLFLHRKWLGMKTLFLPNQ